MTSHGEVMAASNTGHSLGGRFYSHKEQAFWLEEANNSSRDPASLATEDDPPLLKDSILSNQEW